MCVLPCMLSQLLSLNGGESPVMGTMEELDAENAYTIMSYMSVQVGKLAAYESGRIVWSAAYVW